MDLSALWRVHAGTRLAVNPATNAQEKQSCEVKKTMKMASLAPNPVDISSSIFSNCWEGLLLSPAAPTCTEFGTILTPWRSGPFHQPNFKGQQPSYTPNFITIRLPIRQ